MTRKSPYDTVREITKVLRKNKELPIKSIANEIGSQWDTTLTALEFMKELKIVKERDGKMTYRTERLFSLRLS